MSRFVVRVWLPDRPGALGAVASRIGAVRGDVVGIDILEQGGGRAIDELVVDLADASLVDLMVAEIFEVDGVDVEDVREVAEVPDARLDALETAAELVEAVSVLGLLAALVDQACRVLEADWAAAVDGAGRVPAGAGNHPTEAWLAAFLAGSRSSGPVAEGLSGPDDVAWSALVPTDLALALGRSGRPFRTRERRQLAALGRIAGTRSVQIDPGLRSSVGVVASAGG